MFAVPWRWGADRGSYAENRRWAAQLWGHEQVAPMAISPAAPWTTATGRQALPMIEGDATGNSYPALGQPAILPRDCQPLLLVVIDTEEEFDWRRPHGRENISVTAIAAQGLAQDIFARHEVVPTYVVDYPVASNLTAVDVLREFA